MIRVLIMLDGTKKNRPRPSHARTNQVAVHAPASAPSCSTLPTVLRTDTYSPGSPTHVPDGQTVAPTASPLEKRDQRRPQTLSARSSKSRKTMPNGPSAGISSTHRVTKRPVGTGKTQPLAPPAEGTRNDGGAPWNSPETKKPPSSRGFYGGSDRRRSGDLSIFSRWQAL